MVLQIITAVLQIVLAVLCGLAIGYHFTTRKMVGNVLNKLQDVLKELKDVIDLNQRINDQDKKLIENTEKLYKGIYNETRFIRQNMIRRKTPIIDE